MLDCFYRHRNYNTCVSTSFVYSKVSLQNIMRLSAKCGYLFIYLYFCNFQTLLTGRTPHHIQYFIIHRDYRSQFIWICPQTVSWRFVFIRLSHVIPEQIWIICILLSEYQIICVAIFMYSSYGMVLIFYNSVLFLEAYTLCNKASDHHANLPLEMYSFTL